MFEDFNWPIAIVLIVAILVFGGAKVACRPDPVPVPSEPDAPCFESAILPDAATRFECPPGAQVAVNRPGEGERPDDGPAFLCLCPAMDEIDEAVVGLEVEVTP